MRKLYLSAVLAAGLSLAVNGQFTDDIESYDEGALFNDTWTTWNGQDDGEQNAIVSTAQASSGEKSIFIDAGTGPNGGPQDAVLDLGGVATEGAWTLSFMMYIPDGNSAYLNLQGNVVPNANANLEFLSGNITFNAANGSPGEGADDNANGASTFTFPHSEWFPVIITVNMDAGIYSLNIDGTETPAASFSEAADVFGGLDLYAADADNGYYVDDVEFAETTTSVYEFTADNYSVYPNPVHDQLNVNTSFNHDSVIVYDLLGQVVLESSASEMKTTLDMSTLISGTYFVQIIAGEFSKTIKVMK